MIFHIEHNGKLTMVGFHKYRIITDKKTIEFNPFSEEITVFNICDKLTITSNWFGLVSPYNYGFSIERMSDTCSYDAIHAIQSSRYWLLWNEAEFRLENVKIVVNDEDLRIIVLIPHDAKVTLEQPFDTHNDDE